LILMKKYLKYKYKDHTADVEFNAFGTNITQLFKNSELALFNIVGDLDKIRNSKLKTNEIIIKEFAIDLEDLLWQTLQKSLSILDAKNQFGYTVIKVNIKKINKDINQRYRLILTIKSKTRIEKYSKLEAKGVSKYNLKINKNNNNFISNIVVDV